MGDMAFDSDHHWAWHLLSILLFLIRIDYHYVGPISRTVNARGYGHATDDWLPQAPPGSGPLRPSWILRKLCLCCFAQWVFGNSNNVRLLLEACLTPSGGFLLR